MEETYFGINGILYGNFLEKSVGFTTKYLQTKIQDLSDKLSEKPDCIAYSMEIMVAKDLVNAREDPQGETAQRINPIIDFYTQKE